MKRKIRTAPRAIPLVPTASMADIAFLLIIFFMLTTSFSPVKVNVDLPESREREETSDEPAIVAITLQGQVVFSDGEQEQQEIQIADLEPLSLAVVYDNPDKEFVIKADQAVPYDLVDQVLEALRKAGVRHIGFLTNQQVKGEI